MERAHPKFQLRSLQAADAAAFATLYADPAVNHGHEIIAAGEMPVELLARISGLCEVHLGIVVSGRLIGDCALHHWNPESGSIEIGGAILPAYQGQGIMTNAFHELISIARKLGAARISGRTDPGNHSAIRLVERLGFVKNGLEEGELVLTLDLER